MHRSFVDGAGDDLHRIVMHTVATYGLDRRFAAQEHAVPREHRLVGKLRVEMLIKIDHHLRDAALGG